MEDETETISKGMELRTSEVRYRRLFESAKDGILILNFESRKITDANPFIAELLGYSHDELVGRELWEIGLLSDARSAHEAFRELQDKGFIRYEDLPLQTKDGLRREVEFVSNVYLEDSRNVIQCNIRDITQRKEEQRDLRKVNSELTAMIAELRRRDAEMSTLNRLHEVLHACATREEACQVITAFAGELFPGQSGCLAIFDASRGELEQSASWGETELVDAVFSPDDCWALRRDHLHEVPDSQVAMLCRHFVHRPNHGYVCVPLTVRDEMHGILCLLGTDDWGAEYHKSKVRLAVAVGEAVKMSLSKLTLQDKLRDQAIRDPLTGLLNRRYLEEILIRDLHRAQRRNSDMCVVMLDIDNFKTFNDTFGHAAGDSILREVARVMRGTLRKSDIVCRYGGDEFVLVMSDSSWKDSRTRMEQIGAKIKEMRLHAKFGPVTFSAGIAQAGIDGSDSMELLHAADRALYVAKAGGGDHVAIFQETKSNKAVGS